MAPKSNETAQEWKQWCPSPADTAADVLLIYRYPYVTVRRILYEGDKVQLIYLHQRIYREPFTFQYVSK